MTYWKKKVDWHNEDVVQQYDDASWWSQLAGNLIFENLSLRGVQRFLDIGCGTGYPLINLAERFGPNTIAYGLDIWEEAIEVVRQKKEARDLSNVEIILADASEIPLPDAHVDLVVSNLGVNNFSNRKEVLQEISRILRPEGKLAISTNLRGTFKEYYTVLEDIVNIHHPDGIKDLQNHMNERTTESEMKSLGNDFGLKVVRTVFHTAQVQYANGSAFLNDYFIRMGFLPSWVGLFPGEMLDDVMSEIERRLNSLSTENNGLILSVPIMYIEFEK